MLELLLSDFGSLVVAGVVLLFSLSVAWRNYQLHRSFMAKQREQLEDFYSKMDAIVVRDVHEELASNLIALSKERLGTPDNVTEITLLDGTIMHVIENTDNPAEQESE